jgi:hypothetical protein
MKETVSRAEFNEYARHSDELLQLEIQILQYAAENGHNENFCANRAWYRNFKGPLCELVGWSAKDARLNTSKAYDVVYSYLYELLPDCKHEGAICL